MRTSIEVMCLLLLLVSCTCSLFPPSSSTSLSLFLTVFGQSSDCPKCSMDQGGHLQACGRAPWFGEADSIVFLTNIDCSTAGSSPTSALKTLISTARSDDVDPVEACTTLTRNVLCTYLQKMTKDFSQQKCPLKKLCQIDCITVRNCQTGQVDANSNSINCDNGSPLVEDNSMDPSQPGWANCVFSGIDPVSKQRKTTREREREKE